MCLGKAVLSLLEEVVTWPLIILQQESRMTEAHGCVQYGFGNSENIF